MTLNITACRRCASSINETMRFCPQCGTKIAGMSKSMVVTTFVAAVGLFGATYGLQRYLQPPQQGALAKHHSEQPLEAEAHDPEIEALRKSVESDPQNMEKLKMLAGMLGDKLRNSPQPSQALALEAVDVLARILALSPNDPGALVMMADVSFDQRAFTKAQEFYERYLKLEPQNLGARARYASTLTFLGNYDKSIAELNTVLKADPKNFPALAYLSITYAQRGDVVKAREVGATALNLAPSDEAKARFSAFVETIGEKGEAVESTSPPRGNIPAKGSGDAPGTGGISSFIATVQANPVAGPKFVSYEETKQGILRLVFRDFPMAQMPPFAKEKFFNTLRQAAQSAKLNGVSSIVFVDAATQSEMENMPLPRS